MANSKIPKLHFNNSWELHREEPNTTHGYNPMSNDQLKFSSAGELGRQAGCYFGSRSNDCAYKDWNDYAQKELGIPGSMNEESDRANPFKNVDWFDPRPKNWEEYAKLEFNPHASFEEFLDTMSKYAPKASAYGRIPHEMKPESAWTKPIYDRENANTQNIVSNDDIVEQAIKKTVRKGVNSFRYVLDAADDSLYRGTTYMGNALGYMIADKIAELSGMPYTDRTWEELYGTINQRVPIEGRGYKAYMDAIERGEDPSKWYAHAIDMDIFDNWHPESELERHLKGLTSEALNYVAPSELAKGAALTGINKFIAAPVGKTINTYFPKVKHPDLWEFIHDGVRATDDGLGTAEIINDLIDKYKEVY